MPNLPTTRHRELTDFETDLLLSFKEELSGVQSSTELLKECSSIDEFFEKHCQQVASAHQRARDKVESQLKG